MSVPVESAELPENHRTILQIWLHGEEKTFPRQQQVVNVSLMTKLGSQLSCPSLSVHMAQKDAKLKLACCSAPNMPYMHQMLPRSHQR